MTAPEIEIIVDGEPLRVAAGTTLAVALLNAGVRAFRTSASGAPRAPLCGMGTCYECRVTVDHVVGRRACLVPCVPGMVVHTADGDD
ncbi:MAG TPA: (2Fe-2S)-binding protein [Gemmatimonadaceae bacterium]|jgi:predicted molibdopterin-dependent oxidoreductase YjgC|nr:(2Fe-2S)-binding protein [Gemmatimonadaceae bacterium]